MSETIRSLRTFGLMVGGVFLLLGIWPMLAHRQGPRAWALVVSVLLVGPALIHPRLLGPAHRAWMKVGNVLAFINTRIVLAVLFFLVFAPIGLILRLLGQDPMRRGYDRHATTYRQPREARPSSHMKHQF